MMIIVGYQGIGKSTISDAYNGNQCIDLESGNFFVNGKRADDWYKPYCQIANHLSEQGYTVFVSSHEVVRKELEKSKELVCVVCPSVELENAWIDKLAKRYAMSQLDKDRKAYLNAKDRYKDNIIELIESPFVSYEIKNINYDLKDIVKTLRRLEKWDE